MPVLMGLHSSRTHGIISMVGGYVGNSVVAVGCDYWMYLQKIGFSGWSSGFG